ncbi:MAG: PKD domain-containing protein [Oceanipulchritudo sp.]
MLPRLRPPLIGFLLFILPSLAPAEVLVITAQPAQRLSTLFTASVDGHGIPVHQVDDQSTHPSLQGNRQLHYLRFAFTGTVTLEITANLAFSNYTLSPTRLEQPSGKSANTVSITLEQPGKFVLRSSELGLTGGSGLVILAEAIRPDQPAPGDPGVLSVLDTGADNTGAVNETTRLQSAIDLVSTDPAYQTLYFPAGTYLTSALTVKSNVQLYLAPGAVLQFTGSGGYVTGCGGNLIFKGVAGMGDTTTWCENSGIDGYGTVDGNSAGNRHLILWKARNVQVRNTLFVNGSNWLGHVIGSDQAVFENYMGLTNGRDALNIDCSRNIRMSDLFLASSDDAHCLKVLRTIHNGLPAPRQVPEIQNISMRDSILFQETYKGPNIGSEWFGSRVEKVLYENLDIIRVGNSMIMSNGEDDNNGMVVTDVTYRNVWAEYAGSLISVNPSDSGSVRGVTYDNVHGMTNSASQISLGNAVNPPGSMDGFAFRWLYLQGQLKRDLASMNIDPDVGNVSIHPSPATAAVELFAPAGSSLYRAGQSVLLKAHAAAAEPRSIESVRFFVEGTPIGTATLDPEDRWHLAWTPPASGAYTVTARMTDSAGQTLDAEGIDIFVTEPGNQPPVAVIDAAPLRGNAPLGVSFSATGSLDPDGTILLYEWDFDSDGVYDANGPTAFHTYTLDSLHKCTLRVVDDGYAAGTAEVVIQVGNVPPVAAFNATPSSGLPPLAVTFDASGSYDIDGAIVLHEWDLDGNGTYEATGLTTSTTYNNPGSVTVSLRVTDDLGGTDVTTGAITVNEPPYSNAIALYGRVDGPEGGYVSSDKGWTRAKSTTTATLVEWAFSDTIPLMLNGGGYAGPDIFGGFRAERLSGTTALSINENRIQNRVSGAADVVRMTNRATGTTSHFTGLLYFPLVDPVTPTATTRIESQCGLNGSTVGTEVRYVINENGSFFISEATVGYGTGSFNSTSATYGLGQLELGSETGRYWRAYDPADALPRDSSSALRDTTSAPFTRIDGVGFHYDQPAIANDKEQHVARLTLFNTQPYVPPTLPRPTASIHYDASDWILSVPSSSGFFYQILTSPDLSTTPADWEPAGEPQSGSDGVTLVFRLSMSSWPAAPTRFFVLDVTAQ